MFFPATGCTLLRNYCDVFLLSQLENVTCSQFDGRLMLESKQTLVHKFVSKVDIQVFNSVKLHEIYVTASVGELSIFHCAG